MIYLSDFQGDVNHKKEVAGRLEKLEKIKDLKILNFSITQR